MVRRNIRLLSEEKVLIVRKPIADFLSDAARHRCAKHKYSINLLCDVAIVSSVGRNIYDADPPSPPIRTKLSRN